jgi:TRAP-type uncharacterized transport system substrate-binding protein
MTIATASPGGVGYPYGHGLAMLLTKYVGITFTDQATQGPVQDVLLVEQRKAMLGHATMVWHGRRGTAPAGQKERSTDQCAPSFRCTIRHSSSWPRNA